MRLRAFLLATLAALLVGARSRADVTPPSDKPDTAYGRIDGDLGASLGAGTTAGSRGLRGAADLRLRYLDTAGVFVSYEEGPLFGSPAEPQRVLVGGLELRPLFLARWLNGAEVGWDRLDLAIDSLGLELGAVAEQPAGRPFGSRPGLQLGLGLELPVGTNASGPWIGLHGGVRWGYSALEGEPVQDANDRALFLMITLAYHQIFGAHVVDVGDTAPR